MSVPSKGNRSKIHYRQAAISVWQGLEGVDAFTLQTKSSTRVHWSFYFLKDQYQYFLNQRNELGYYRNSALRSAFRSIDSNMLYLFTYTDIKNSNIPPTINHLEGLFGHLKERIKIHRGLNKNRKKKAVRFLLKNWQKKSTF